MIDPLTGAALNGALSGITAQMAGQGAATAYGQRMDNSYLDDSGIEIGYSNVTTNKPAISGDTSGTIIDSSEADPQEAWLDWMHDGGLVSETTGGALIGSDETTFNYCIGEDNGQAVAIQPVAVEADRAVVAICQALGVSMKLSEVNPVLANKFTRALTTAGVVYNAAKNLVTAWWDGINILFPKKAAEAINNVLVEEGIGGDPGHSSDLDIDGLPMPLGSSSSASSLEELRPDFFAITYTSFSGQIIVFTDSLTHIAASSIPNCPYRINWEYRDGSQSGYFDYTCSTEYTYDGKTVYYNTGSWTTVGGFFRAMITGCGYSGTSLDAGQIRNAAWTMIYGEPSGEFPEGTADSSATHYTPETLNRGADVWGKTVPASNPEKIADTVKIHLPVNALDTIGDTTDPSTATDTEEKDKLKNPPVPLPIPRTKPDDPTIDLVDSTVIPAEKIDELVEELANTVDPQPPESTGLIPIPPFMPGTPVDPTDPSAGSLYPTIVPSSGSGFIHVYNPTPAEFVAFGHWLWVTYADATIDKIWNNPFDGVLGAHELYATPGVSGSDNIRSGFLVCPTTAALVPNRYTEIDCGTVIVPEFYGNYLDYSPYSQCYIYLPFIGINEVSIDDIVGHAVNIRYRVDSYSGACIAMIYVAKQGYRNLCYQFAGNCAVEVPLAGGSQAAIKAGMMQAEAYGRATVQSAQIQKTAKIGTGIVGGAASGAGAGAMNPVAGIVGGLLGALAGGTSGYIQGSADYGAAKLSAGAMQEAARVANKSSVQHSGQFGASHGAMGLKVPFIMVRNPVQVKVVNYNHDYGFPAHKRVIIGGCTGYLRVREVNVISAHATNEEKIAIEMALKEGVYVS